MFSSEWLVTMLRLVPEALKLVMMTNKASIELELCGNFEERPTWIFQLIY